MRPSLLPGLLAAAQRNHDRGADSIRLFEIGRRYLAEEEHVTLSLVLAGDAAPRDWRTGKAKPFEAFDAKAEALAALAAAGAPVERLQVISPAGPAYTPGRPGQPCLGPKQVVARFGELSPSANERASERGREARTE